MTPLAFFTFAMSWVVSIVGVVVATAFVVGLVVFSVALMLGWDL